MIIRELGGSYTRLIGSREFCGVSVAFSCPKIVVDGLGELQGTDVKISGTACTRGTIWLVENSTASELFNISSQSTGTAVAGVTSDRSCGRRSPLLQSFTTLLFLRPVRVVNSFLFMKIGTPYLIIRPLTGRECIYEGRAVPNCSFDAVSASPVPTRGSSSPTPLSVSASPIHTRGLSSPTPLPPMPSQQDGSKPTDSSEPGEHKPLWEWLGALLGAISTIAAAVLTVYLTRCLKRNQQNGSASPSHTENQMHSPGGQVVNVMGGTANITNIQNN